MHVARARARGARRVRELRGAPPPLAEARSWVVLCRATCRRGATNVGAMRLGPPSRARARACAGRGAADTLDGDVNQES